MNGTSGKSGRQPIGKEAIIAPSGFSDSESVPSGAAVAFIAGGNPGWNPYARGNTAPMVYGYPRSAPDAGRIRERGSAAARRLGREVGPVSTLRGRYGHAGVR
ncbi:hypothetical protein GCM10023166_12670 [Paeniglutamicibacter cryotolerans]